MPGSVSSIDASCEAPNSADSLAHAAAHLLAADGPAALAVYDTFPGPLYATDAEGRITYFNAACVALAGKAPTLGIQRWCVCDTVRSVDGELIDPAHGPNAVALRSGAAIRALRAIVERPDGEQIPVRPYPTPAIDEAGMLVGLVSVVVPLDGKIRDQLIETAERCKTLGQWICDPQASDALNKMAIECERHAEVLRPA